MKKLYFILILFIFIPIVNASISNDTTYELDNNINLLFENNNSYITLENNTINKYDSNWNNTITKTIDNLKNISIIPYQNNYFVIGTDNTFLKIYILNEYLQITDMKETTISASNVSLYNYNNKIYFLLNTNYIIDDIHLYEVDDKLEIKENNLSSYGDTLLKEILKSDYYAIKNEDLTKTIIDTAYSVDYNVLLYTKDNEYYLNIIEDNKDIKIAEAKEILILNNKIYSLNGNTLNSYTFEGTLDNAINLNEEYDHIFKTDNLYLVNNHKISIYNYEIKLEVEESNLGTLEIEDVTTPNQKVKYTVKPNSGYELEKLIITDEYGNVIESTNGTFITPNSNAKVLAVYKETVNNPDTIDRIVVVAIISGITFILVTYFYKKIRWINN